MKKTTAIESPLPAMHLRPPPRIVALPGSAIGQRSPPASTRLFSGSLHESKKYQLADLFDAAQFPLLEELKKEVREQVQELSLVCDSCKTGLDPLERKLREAFRKAMTCRNEGLELLGRATEP